MTVQTEYWDSNRSTSKPNIKFWFIIIVVNGDAVPIP